MTGIWHNTEGGWELLASSGFTDEAALHRLVASAPQVLPLAGNPQLVVVGSEVQLGSGYADLVAIETSGRLAVIEVKLARNAEARRAVVAQALAYAAYLHGVDREALESRILGRHLRQLGYASLLEAARSVDQHGAIDEEEFGEAVSAHLAEGSFRVVFVLDDAPNELVRLTGYLEAVTDRLTIDLVTVASYEVNGSRMILPRRVAPGLVPPHAPPSRVARTAEEGYLSDGSGDFRTAIERAPESQREGLLRLLRWAESLEAEGLVTLATYHGRLNRLTLLPRLRADGVGLVTIWLDSGGAALSFWRSVFERHCPEFIAGVEETAGASLRQGNTIRPCRIGSWRRSRRRTGKRRASTRLGLTSGYAEGCPRRQMNNSLLIADPNACTVPGGRLR